MSWAKQWSSVVLGILSLTVPPAAAQEQAGFELQHLRPNPELSSGGFVTVNPAALGHVEWRAHVLLNYANNPLVLYDRNDARVAGAVSRQGTVHLLGAIGLFDFAEIGVDLPVIIHQAGESLPAAVAPPILHSAGFGDLRLLPKAQFLNWRFEALRAELKGAFIAEVFLPTGSDEGLRGGDARIGPRLAFDATFSGGHRVGTNLGYLHRSARQFGDLHIGDTVGWSVYGEVPVAQKISVTGEMFGRLGTAAQSRQHAQMEGLLGLRATAFNLRMMGAVGVGFGRAYGTPDWRGLLAIEVPVGRRASPPAHVPPAPPPEAAAAPVPEPATVVEAPVAAPEPSNEPPVVAVAEAPAPAPEPEVQPAPAPPPVRNVKIDHRTRKLELADTIHFETGSARISPESFGLLDEVAALLRDHPEIESLTIEGHTDNRGGRAYNLQLSRARAAALREYIISRGIAPERIVSEGYGMERPVATNATAEGRAKNRRVDFKIDEITVTSPERQNTQE